MVVTKTRALFVVCLTWMVAAGLTISKTRAAEKDSESKPSDSFEEQLNKDLQTDLLEGLDVRSLPDKKPLEKKPDDKTTGDKKPEQKTSGETTRSGAGEDIGEESGDNELTRIGRQMMKSQDLLNKLSKQYDKQSAESTQQLQQKIIDDLAALIDRLNQSPQRGRSSTNNASGKTIERIKIPPKNGDSQKASGAKNEAEVTSTSRLGKSKPQTVDREKIKKSIEKSWGDLPPKIRELMRLSASETFLPEFELMIENYFKRLAEEK